MDDLELNKVKELYGKSLKKISILNVEIENLRKEIEILKLKKDVKVGRKGFDDYGVIKMMFDMYLSDFSFAAIATFLNDSSIKTKAGGIWSKSSVSLVLKNNIELLSLNEKTIFNEKLDKCSKKKLNTIK